MNRVIQTTPLPSTPADILSGYMRVAQEYESDPADRPDLWGQMRALAAHAAALPARDVTDVAVKLRLLADIGTDAGLLRTILADTVRIGGAAVAPVPGLDRLRSRARQRGHHWTAALLARYRVQRFADLSADQVSRELRRP